MKAAITCKGGVDKTKFFFALARLYADETVCTEAPLTQEKCQKFI